VRLPQAKGVGRSNDELTHGFRRHEFEATLGLPESR
jgi:hypothetical protein